MGDFNAPSGRNYILLIHFVGCIKECGLLKEDRCRWCLLITERKQSCGLFTTGSSLVACTDQLIFWSGQEISGMGAVHLTFKHPAQQTHVLSVVLRTPADYYAHWGHVCSSWLEWVVCGRTYNWLLASKIQSRWQWIWFQLEFIWESYVMTRVYNCLSCGYLLITQNIRGVWRQ